MMSSFRQLAAVGRPEQSPPVSAAADAAATATAAAGI